MQALSGAHLGIARSLHIYATACEGHIMHEALRVLCRISHLRAHRPINLSTHTSEFVWGRAHGPHTCFFSHIFHPVGALWMYVMMVRSFFRISSSLL